MLEISPRRNITVVDGMTRTWDHMELHDTEDKTEAMGNRKSERVQIA